MWSFMGDPWLQHSGKYLWGAVQQAGAAWNGRGGHPLDFLLLFSFARDRWFLVCEVRKNNNLTLHDASRWLPLLVRA